VSGSSTDQQIREATIGEPTVLNDQVTLVEYDPEWPRHFEREAARIRKALGDRALRIEHAGSTSVPGLAAKPIVDIVLEVADSSDEPSYVASLESVGYVLRIREAKWHEHRMFKGPETPVNLHVFSHDCSETQRMISFRDRLRANQSDRELYARTKRTLAQRKWKFVQNYADSKSEIVEAIVARARSGSELSADEAGD
jgi:GrpB-like predicted nucleotidyltransferase (UPF0157 family)